jgi:hypothetical protein
MTGGAESMARINEENVFVIIETFLQRWVCTSKAMIGGLTRHVDDQGIHFGFIAMVGQQISRETVENEILTGLQAKIQGVEATKVWEPPHASNMGPMKMLVCVISSQPALNSGFDRYVYTTEWIKQMPYNGFVVALDRCP